MLLVRFERVSCRKMFIRWFLWLGGGGLRW